MDEHWYKELLRALQDPRLGMMMAPYGALLKGPGFARQMMQLIPSMSQRGSFNPGGYSLPTSIMRQQGGEANHLNTQQVRDDFLERTGVYNNLASQGPTTSLPSEIADIVNKTKSGMRSLLGYRNNG